MTMKPLLSVLTPSLNRADMIETAIESVLSQDYQTIEHIIVDGGSTDGTLELLKKYSHLKIIVGQDDGMYDALNRGIALARGEIICFLNTDDRFLPDSFLQVIPQFENQNTDAVIGQASIVSSGGIPLQGMLRVQPEHWWETLILGYPIFNAWFFRHAVIHSLGGFDTRFKIAGDRDYLIRFGAANFNPVFIDSPLYEYTVHKGSITLGLKSTNIYRMCMENLWLAEKWQKIITNSPQVDLYLQQLARRSIAEMAIQALKDKSIGKFISYIRLGSQCEPTFPLFFSKKVILGILSKISKRLHL